MLLDTEAGKMMLLSLIFTVAAAVALVAVVVVHMIETRVDREWKKYMEAYAPEWNRDDE